MMFAEHYQGLDRLPDGPSAESEVRAWVCLGPIAVCLVCLSLNASDRCRRVHVQRRGDLLKQRVSSVDLFRRADPHQEAGAAKTAVTVPKVPSKSERMQVTSWGPETQHGAKAVPTAPTAPPPKPEATCAAIGSDGEPGSLQSLCRSWCPAVPEALTCRLRASSHF